MALVDGSRRPPSLPAMHATSYRPRAEQRRSAMASNRSVEAQREDQTELEAQLEAARRTARRALEKTKEGQPMRQALRTAVQEAGGARAVLGVRTPSANGGPAAAGASANGHGPASEAVVAAAHETGRPSAAKLRSSRGKVVTLPHQALPDP